MHPIELTERRIDNAIQAMNRCKEGSWGHNYWGKVVAYLMRKLNGEVNGRHERNDAPSGYQTRTWTH